MSYEVIKLIRQLIGAGIGDTTRLSYILDRLENGKYLYLSDQKYLENIVNTNESLGKRPSLHTPIEFGNLEAELRDINLRLESILQNKVDSEKRISDNVLTTQASATSKQSSIKNTTSQPKSEDTTLVLSVILGLMSLQGIGHIYIHKIAKGVGLLVTSCIISSLAITYFIGITRDAIPLFLQPFFISLLIGVYISLYAFQILDSRKLCSTYNAYLSEHGKRPPWW